MPDTINNKLMTQLAMSITGFIFVIELVVLGFSYVSNRQELYNLRDVLERDVMQSTGQHFADLHPGILDDADIDRRLHRFAVNYSAVTLLITLVVSIGTLLVFHRVAGRYLCRLIDLNAVYSGGKLDREALYFEQRLPSNELADLIISRNRMIESIIHYEECIEDELEQARQKLVHSARLSMIGELTATTVHDIKNPLAVIMGRTALMMRKNPDERLTQYLSTVNEAAEKILALTERMGRFSRLDDHRMELLSLSTVIDSSLEMASAKLSRNAVEISRQIGEDVVLLADQIGLEQVFTNLFNNAADAMARSTRRRLSIGSSIAGAEVTIRVEDTGVGIPPESLDSIFMAFFTTKEVGSGTGLGLSSCKRIVEKHGGAIDAQSRVGQGTTFVIRLPIRYS